MRDIGACLNQEPAFVAPPPHRLISNSDDVDHGSVQGYRGLLHGRRSLHGFCAMLRRRKGVFSLRVERVLGGRAGYEMYW